MRFLLCISLIFLLVSCGNSSGSSGSSGNTKPPPSFLTVHNLTVNDSDVLGSGGNHTLIKLTDYVENADYEAQFSFILPSEEQEWSYHNGGQYDGQCTPSFDFSCKVRDSVGIDVSNDALYYNDDVNGGQRASLQILIRNHDGQEAQSNIFTLTVSNDF